MEKGLLEQCLEAEPDLFTLVVLAAHRSQELAAGLPQAFPCEGHKYPIVALNEIAHHSLNMAQLRGRIVASYRQFSFLSDRGE